MNRRRFIKNAAIASGLIYVPTRAAAQAVSAGGYNKWGSFQEKYFATTPFITSGLEAWWRFTEGAGSTTADASGNNNTGTLVGSPGWSASVPAGAPDSPYSLSFNGTSQSASVAASASLDNWTAQTITLWLNWTNPSASNYPRFIEKGLNNEWTISGYGVGSGLAFSIGSSSPFNEATTYGDGNWHFLALTITGGYVGTLYIDNVQVVSNTGNAPSGKTNGIAIATAGNSDGCCWFPGNLYSIRIYSRVLSSNELTTIFNKQG